MPFLNFQALPLSVLYSKEFEDIHSSMIQTFNRTQAQVSKPCIPRARMCSLEIITSYLRSNCMMCMLCSPTAMCR